MSMANREVARPNEANDPLIEEIRAIRKKISDRFDNDVDRLLDHLKEVERAYSGPRARPQDVASANHTDINR